MLTLIFHIIRINSCNLQIKQLIRTFNIKDKLILKNKRSTFLKHRIYNKQNSHYKMKQHNHKGQFFIKIYHKSQKKN
jgi:hypothetical protein